MRLTFQKGKTIEGKTIKKFYSYSAFVEKGKMIEVKIIKITILTSIILTAIVLS